MFNKNIFLLSACLLLIGCSTTLTPKRSLKLKTNAPSSAARNIIAAPIFAAKTFSRNYNNLIVKVSPLLDNSHITKWIKPAGKYTNYDRFLPVAISITNNGTEEIIVDLEKTWLLKPNGRELFHKNTEDAADSLVNKQVRAKNMAKKNAEAARAATGEYEELKKVLAENLFKGGPIAAGATKNGMLYYLLIWKKEKIVPQFDKYSLVIHTENPPKKEITRHKITFQL